MLVAVANLVETEVLLEAPMEAEEEQAAAMDMAMEASILSTIPLNPALTSALLQ